jgi:ornithine carbamoyltransferase
MAEKNPNIRKKSTGADDSGLVGKDILTTEQLTLKEIESVLNLAQKLKALRDHHLPTRFFKDGIGFGCIQAGTNRHQEAFRFACHLTGLQPETLDISKIRQGGTDFGLFGGIAGIAELIAVDEDTNLSGNAMISELIQFLDQGYQMKVISQRSPLINIRSNLGWPLQALTELLFMKDLFGSMKSLKARKLTITWVFDPDHEVSEILPVSMLRLLSRYGMNITLAHPEGYELPDAAIISAQKSITISKGRLKLTNRFKKSIKSADIIYLIPWRLTKNHDNPDEELDTEEVLEESIVDIEETDKVGSSPEKWILTPRIKALAKDGNVVFMQSKEILHKTEMESFSQFVASEVNHLKRNQLKPYILASMILVQHYSNPNILLQEMINNDHTFIQED